MYIIEHETDGIDKHAESTIPLLPREPGWCLFNIVAHSRKGSASLQ